MNMNPSRDYFNFKESGNPNLTAINEALDKLFQNGWTFAKISKGFRMSKIDSGGLHKSGKVPIMESSKSSMGDKL